MAQTQTAAEVIERQPLFVTLAGMVNQEMSYRVFSAITKATFEGFSDFHLLIQSTGGYVADGVCIHNYLTNVPMRVVTYNAGQVSSVAVLVYLAGRRRRVADTASFLLHRPAQNASGAQADVLGAIADTLRIDEDRQGAILRSQISMPSESWAAYAKHDLPLDAKAACKFNVAHDIGAFKPLVGVPLWNI